MESFKTVKSIITPLDEVNVDTDQIIPKQFLKLVQKSGFGKFLFFHWRFDEKENPKSDFVLNDSKYDGSHILVAGDNFGCGSSREHAVWALQDYGFTVIIAPSFADIFFSNCFKNGILPISLDQKIVENLQQTTDPIEVNLETQTIETSSDEIHFEIDSHMKKILLEGLDDISQTLQFEDKITDFEKRSKIPSVL
ncbi:MAG: 3-isopropylmalate dehydratase small subunit [Thaumarchaeota archaeon]|jgi:3-isopropylmalate/(R)-2-methylmalate dehydratase small subunit|nr:MAG: 3-isopropylmalate dehydratase small subunit [Nitrososphaerota archaeon]